MRAFVTGITSHHSGFGQYQRSEEAEVEGDWSSVEEYAEHVTRTAGNIVSYAIDPDVAEMGDADGEKLAEKLREVKGAVLGGHDTLVAYWLGVDSIGYDQIIVESVRLID